MSFLQSKKIDWQRKREEKWTEEYALREKEFRKQIDEVELRTNSLEIRKLELEDLERRINDRKLELEHENEELKNQIRLIEAKARPDSIWVSAFSEGFGKAWDMMIPLMTKGVENLKDSIRTQAIDETLDGLETTIGKRIEAAGLTNIKSQSELIGKKQSFELKKSGTRDPLEKSKYQNYIDAIDWMLDGNVSKEN